MGFSSPSAFWLALLVLPIAALYLLKIRSRRVTVSTGVFWDDSLLAGQKPFPWKSLRHWVSLLLQISLLILIVLSIADPYILSHRRAARRMVLVIDNSASMRATDIRPSRLEAAQDSAIALIDGMKSEDEAAVLTAGPNPQVVAGTTTDTSALRKAVRSITFSDCSSQTEAAVSFAEKLIGRHPHGEVIVLTDGCAPDLRPAHTVQELSVENPDKESPKADRSPLVALRVFGTKASNVGITQFQVRRSYADPTGYQVFLSVRNASATAVRCRVVLTMDNVPVDVIPLSLSPEELWTRSLEKASSGGGVIRATLTDVQPESSAMSSVCNQLSTDDTAWAILPARKVQKVHLVTKGNLFLEKVFEANPLADLTASTTLLQRSGVVPDEILVLHKEI
ncbi:MAG: vWA domain-containing protein, partial [Planctomyces sp.]